MTCFGKDPLAFSLVRSSIFATIGPTTGKFILGHAYFWGVRLRLFGLVRRRRNHWINAMFIETKDEKDIFGLEAPEKLPKSSSGTTDWEETYVSSQLLPLEPMKKTVDQLTLLIPLMNRMAMPTLVTKRPQ